MSQVQATIQLLVDFHGHLKETGTLQAKAATTRKDFLKACALALHGERLAEFIGLTQANEFNPILTLDATGHPSFEEIRDNLVAAVDLYNNGEYPLAFNTDLLMAPAAPPYACIRWVWQNGHWVAVYNYDLVAIDPSKLPKSGTLTARYHAALTYSRSIVGIQE